MAPGRGVQAQSGLETKSPQRRSECFVAGFMLKLQFGFTSTRLDLKFKKREPKTQNLLRLAFCSQITECANSTLYRDPWA